MGIAMITAALFGALLVVAALYVREERRHDREMDRLRAAEREILERHHAAVMALYGPPVEVVTNATTRRAEAASPPPGYGTATVGYYNRGSSAPSREAYEAFLAGREVGKQVGDAWSTKACDAAFLRSIGVQP